MAGEQSEAFPDEVQEWVEQKADELDASPEEVLTRAVSVYRVLDEESEDAEGVEDRWAELDDRLRSLSDRVDALDADLDEMITDVRERVIQVKREADAKAPKDHDHPEMQERLVRAIETADEAATAIEDVESRLESGFENYEEVLEYLTETTDDLSEKIDALAGAVVNLRTRAAELESAAQVRNAAAELQAEANRHGETTASCADCGATVHLGLLSRPHCPHCEARFVEFEPSRGFFGTATLEVGERPALEGATEGGETKADLFEETEGDET